MSLTCSKIDNFLECWQLLCMERNKPLVFTFVNKIGSPVHRLCLLTHRWKVHRQNGVHPQWMKVEVRPQWMKVEVHPQWMKVELCHSPVDLWALPL